MTPIQFLKNIFKQNKKIFFHLLFAAGIARILDLLLPYAFKNIIDESNQYLLSEGNSTLKIWIWCGVLCGTALISKIFYRLCDHIEIKFVPQISEDISSKLFSYVTDHSVSYFQNNFSGAIAHKIKQVSEITKYFFSTYAVSLLQVFIVLTFSSIIIFPKSLSLSIFIFGFGSVYVYFSYKMAIKSKQLAAAWSTQSSTVTGNLIDSIENIILVKSLGKQNQEISHIKEHLSIEKDTFVSLKKYMNKMKIVHGVISSLLISVTVLYAVYLLLNKAISIGDTIFIFMIITRLSGEFFALGDITTDILEKYGILQEALGFIYKEQEEQKLKPNISINNAEIVFDNTVFGYNPNKLIFDGLNLHIHAKEKIALVGHSGSGKSTLTKLILKQHKVKSGNILIDNQNLNDFNVDSINEKITYIHQDIHLFNRSIRENILYAKPEANEEELIEVCRKSGCLEFIMKKENGFDTIVGERGVQLSGGEKQLLALARAFLLNNPILILDEPTSALDSISESIIQESLNELIKDKTVIIIAHRLATIQHMDKVVVMNNGAIAEQGTHEELLKKNGIYLNLWKSQTY